MNNIKPHCVRLIVIAVIVALTATASMAQTHRTSIRVAAADSGPSDKEMADIVCDGRHDEIPLRRALESLGGCGRLEMASGNYIIDSFFTAEDGSGYVLRTPYDSNIRIEGDLPNWNGEGVRLRVSQDCYDSLSDVVTYSVIWQGTSRRRCRRIWRWRMSPCICRTTGKGSSASTATTLEE